MADKQHICISFSRHFSRYEREASVQRDIADNLDAALDRYASNLRVTGAMEIGIGTGFLTRHLAARYPGAEWWFNDLVPAAFERIPHCLSQVHILPGDAEELTFPTGLDLLASASTVQWFDAPARFIRKSANALRNGGILAISTFGRNNFAELRALTGTGLPYPDLSQWRKWLEQEGFRILTMSEWRCRLCFPGVRELLLHLRDTGVNGNTSVHIATPAQMFEFERRYRCSFSEADARLPLTYHPILFLAQKESD